MAPRSSRRGPPGLHGRLVRSESTRMARKSPWPPRSQPHGELFSLLCAPSAVPFAPLFSLFMHCVGLVHFVIVVDGCLGQLNGCRLRPAASGSSQGSPPSRLRLGDPSTLPAPHPHARDAQHSVLRPAPFFFAPLPRPASCRRARARAYHAGPFFFSHTARAPFGLAARCRRARISCSKSIPRRRRPEDSSGVGHLSTEQLRALFQRARVRIRYSLSTPATDTDHASAHPLRSSPTGSRLT